MDGLSVSCSINISENDADEVTDMDVLVMEDTVGDLLLVVVFIVLMITVRVLIEIPTEETFSPLFAASLIFYISLSAYLDLNSRNVVPL